MKLSSNAIDTIICVVVAITIALMVFFYTPHTRAQSAIILKGNVFYKDSTSREIKKDNPTLTRFFYVDSTGTKYPIYMSASGKCFILRTSSKTGKVYKQYLPEITRTMSKMSKK